MKILYVCTTTDMGGAEKALFSLACACQEKGHQVKVISLKAAGSVARLLKEKNIEVVSFNLRGLFRPVETAGVLARLIQEIQSFQPDVVHASLYRAIQLCRMAKKRIAFKLLTTPHYDLSKQSFFHRFLDRALKPADDVSCAESRSTETFLKNTQRYAEEKLRLVNNGVDTAVFKFSPQKAQEMREKLGFTAENVVFICTARLSVEKNHLLLLESFAALKQRNPQVRLLLAGDGSEREKLQSFVKEKGLEKEVSFLGEVSNIVDFLLVSDVFILVSSIESLPISLLEACSCSLPAIVSKCGDMPRVVLHGQSGFVCNGQDPVLLSVLMAELAENKSLRKKMGQKAREIIEQNYSTPTETYLQLYEELK